MRDLPGGCGTCMLSLVSNSGVLLFMLTLREFDNKGALLK